MMLFWRDLQLVSGAREPRVFDFKGGSAQSDFAAAIDRIYGTGRTTADADTLLAELRTTVVSRQAAAHRSHNGAGS
ncbi:MAG: hypothetical protein AAGA65_30040 [Actinomycetota bacterium]